MRFWWDLGLGTDHVLTRGCLLSSLRKAVGTFLLSNDSSHDSPFLLSFSYLPLSDLRAIKKACSHGVELARALFFELGCT